MTDTLTAPPLGVPRLEDFLKRTLERRDTRGSVPASADDWALDLTLLNGLGLHVRSALSFVLETTPSLEALERWVLAKNGGAIAQDRLARLNAALEGTERVEAPEPRDAILDEASLASFAAHGLVLVRGVASEAECDAARAAIWEHLGGVPTDPRIWPTSPLGSAVEVPLAHHPALDAIRRSARARHAFEQLWRRTDLWPVVDLPVLMRPDPAPSGRLRWEVDPTPPVAFGLRGLVYLEDTPLDRGAFACVDGFHARIDAWLAALPPNALPQDQDLTADGLLAMPGSRGDLLIWHQALPYARAPHLGATPTAALYVSYRPTR